MDLHVERTLQKILLDDPEVAKRIHSPKRAAAHLKRRGFQTSLGNRTPGPPLHWTSLPAPPSMVHGHAWIGLDHDTLQKALALGCLPPRVRRPTVMQAWEWAGGKCRMATVEGPRYAFFQEARMDHGTLALRDPLLPTMRIPASQRCDTHTGPEFRIRCRASVDLWVHLLDATGKPIPNPNRCER